MDPRQLEALAKRLGENPADTEPLHAAYAHGQTDPRGYAVFLEQAGEASADPTYAAHWYSEAATVWSTTLNDTHRAARALLSAVDRDPVAPVPLERLTELYREKQDRKGLIALAERRATNLEALLVSRPELRPTLAGIYVELARLLVEESMPHAFVIEALQKAIEHNPNDIYSIYQARELLKAEGRLAEAVPLFAAEQSLIPGDVERRKALYQDELEVCRQLTDSAGIVRALRALRTLSATPDPNLEQQIGAEILARIQKGGEVSVEDRQDATRAFVSLAETYDGEYGHSYALCALECDPTSDRAAQLAMFYAQQIGKSAETAHPITAYLAANPGGLVAGDARALVLETFSRTAEESLLEAIAPRPDADAFARARGHAELARVWAEQGKEERALEHHRLALSAHPAEEESVEFVSSALRVAGTARELRSVLSAAAEVESAELGRRVAWLHEVAELDEGPLGDVESAIEVRRRLVLLDPTDEDAADRLQASLEKIGRWDDLAELLARRAEVAVDTELRIERERALAALHRDQRGDLVSSAEALKRVARLEPDEAPYVLEAVEAFEKARQPERAIELLGSLLSEMLGADTRVTYSKKLGQLLEAHDDFVSAGGAYAEAASGAQDPEIWERAERCFVRAEAHEAAARAVAEWRGLVGEDLERSRLFAREAVHWRNLGDVEAALSLLEQSSQLDPENTESAEQLESLYVELGRHEALARLLLTRASALSDGEQRVELRKRAAALHREQLGDEEGRREALRLVLEDGEDPEALSVLAEEAEGLGDLDQAIEYWSRFEAVAPEEEKGALARRLAFLFEDQGDEASALEKFRLALGASPEDLRVLSSLARLEERLGSVETAAELYEKLLGLDEVEGKLEIGKRWARLESEELDRPERAWLANERILAIDSEDLEAIEQLRDLSERLSRWEEFAKYQKQLVEVEGDVELAESLALRLAEVQLTELNQPESALLTLEPFAREGEGKSREEYLRIGDSLGQHVQVAEALVSWVQGAQLGPARTQSLRAAYERFVRAERYESALSVGLELVRAKDAGEELAKSLELVSVQAKSVEGLQSAFVVLGRDLSGPPRAEEMVRQAEVLAQAGLDAQEAIQHGEQALTSVAPSEVEELLQRLVALASSDAQAIEIYERQITRAKSIEDRLRAMVRAAAVAWSRAESKKTEQLYEIALQSAGSGEALPILIDAVRDAESASGERQLLRQLIQILVRAGRDERDSARNRGVFLSQAAELARVDLAEAASGYEWLAEALSAHVEESALGRLEAWAEEDGEIEKANAVLGQALDLVHDVSSVRQLLRRRYALRSGRLRDPEGAREDLKRLYELTPGDVELAEKLEALYVESQDHRGLVQLYEDQILRSKDQTQRADLSRKVALLWQDTLNNPREAADAWRRVLRMKAGDEEAKAGLDRAKLAQRNVTPEQIARAEEENRKKQEVTAAAALEASQVLESSVVQEREVAASVEAAGAPELESVSPVPAESEVIEPENVESAASPAPEAAASEAEESALAEAVEVASKAPEESAVDAARLSLEAAPSEVEEPIVLDAAADSSETEEEVLDVTSKAPEESAVDAARLSLEAAPSEVEEPIVLDAAADSSDEIELEVSAAPEELLVPGALAASEPEELIEEDSFAVDDDELWVSDEEELEGLASAESQLILPPSSGSPASVPPPLPPSSAVLSSLPPPLPPSSASSPSVRPPLPPPSRASFPAPPSSGVNVRSSSLPPPLSAPPRPPQAPPAPPSALGRGSLAPAVPVAPPRRPPPPPPTGKK